MAKDGSTVDTKNIITPTLEDLPEEYRLEYEQRKLEFDKLMLSCFQKTRQGIIKKEGELPSVYIKPEAASTVSNASLSEEHIALMIDQQIGATMDRLLSSRLKAIGLEAQSEKNLKQPVLPHVYSGNDDVNAQHNSSLVSTSAANTSSRIIPQSVPMQHMHSRTNGLVPVDHNTSSHTTAIPGSMALVPFSYADPGMINSGARNVDNYSGVRDNLTNLQTPLYHTVAYSTPPIPPQGSGIAYGPLSDGHFSHT